MKKISLAVLLVIATMFTSQAQTSFELLIPWSGDTSQVGLSFQKTPDSGFLILSNLEKFDVFSGIPINGVLSYGTTLTKINENGEILWSQFYDTNTNLIWDLSALGRRPTSSFLQTSENKIILPYSYYLGFATCDDGSTTNNFKRQLLSINANSGIIENNNLFVADSFCNHHEIIAVKKIDSTSFLLLQNDLHTDELTIEKINSSMLDLMDSNAIQTGPSITYFDDFSEAAISIENDKCKLFDYNGIEIQEFLFPEFESINVAQRKLATSENNIAILFSGYQSNFIDRASVLTILDRLGNMISQKYFPDKVLVDLDFTADNQLLVLADNSLNDWEDAIPLPLNISLYDLSLNKIAGNNYGLPYVYPFEIAAIDDDYFGVVGTRLKSLIDAASEKEPDQIYFLKQSINDLLPVGIDPLEKNSTVIEVSPNPVNDVLQIHKGEDIKDLEVAIYNSVGVLISTIKKH